MFVGRVGKAPIRASARAADEGPSRPTTSIRTYYSDWADPREYSIGDIGIGECAGEVVSRYQFDTTAAERMVFEAQLTLETGDIQRAGKDAYGAMLRAAKALVADPVRSTSPTTRTRSSTSSRSAS